MNMKGKSIVILLAEDDEDDYVLITDALKESKVANDVHWVKNGVELMDYLLRQGDYADPVKSPRPCLILLDLNMPKKDGREALQEIKSLAGLRHIPIVVMTTSKTEEDILRSYDLGVNSFINKPLEFGRFIDVVKTMGKYWFEIVELPEEEM
jgi:CheY-like chemotaxis protein